MHELTELIKSDMLPALGVTEPGAIAFSVAKAREYAKGNVNIRFPDLMGNGVLQSCKFSNNQLMVPSGRRSSRDYAHYVGAAMFLFKGETVRFSISDVRPAEVEDNNITVVSPVFIEYILTKIINVINFRYGNQRNEENSSRKAVYYL